MPSPTVSGPRQPNAADVDALARLHKRCMALIDEVDALEAQAAELTDTDRARVAADLRALRLSADLLAEDIESAVAGSEAAAR